MHFKNALQYCCSTKVTQTKGRTIISNISLLFMEAAMKHKTSRKQFPVKKTMAPKTWFFKIK
jgi:hypothetical protein